MIDGTLAAVSAPPRRRLSIIALSSGFALTGAGTVMLGVLLPTLSLRWGLRDDQAGLLLFLQFVAFRTGRDCHGTESHPLNGDRIRVAGSNAKCARARWRACGLFGIFLLWPGPRNGDDIDQPAVFRSMGRRSRCQTGVAELCLVGRSYGRSGLLSAISSSG